MTRHIIDKPKPAASPKRAVMFLRMERLLGRHDSSRALYQRPKRAGAGRLKEFLRIERGKLP